MVRDKSRKTKRAVASERAASRKKATSSGSTGARKAGGARKAVARRKTGARKARVPARPPARPPPARPPPVRRRARPRPPGPPLRARRAAGQGRVETRVAQGPVDRRRPRVGRVRAAARRRRPRRLAARVAGAARARGEAAPRQTRGGPLDRVRPTSTRSVRADAGHANHDVIPASGPRSAGAVPGHRPGTEHDGRPGVLRFDFPTSEAGAARRVDWDEWFETFDERDLVFLFQEQMKNDRQSNFSRLDNQDG